MTGGIIDRLRSMDVGGPAVLAGHVAASAVRNAVSTLLVLGVGFTFVIMFVPYASSAFVPVDTMPSWLRGFAEHQPVTPIIETVRGLLLGHPVGSDPWIALAWCGGILALSVAASGMLFRRRTA